jgi:hypothetical protein
MGEGPIRPEVRNLVMGAIQAHFPPGEAISLLGYIELADMLLLEYINRIDEIILFVRRLIHDCC